MPDDWEQQEHGPKLYIRPATPHKKTHKRTTSISTMTEVTGVEESPAKRQPQRQAPPIPQPQLLAPPRLTRTDSVYPQLQFPKSFRDAVAKHQDELQKMESQQPRPFGVYSRQAHNMDYQDEKWSSTSSYGLDGL